MAVVTKINGYKRRTVTHVSDFIFRPTYFGKFDNCNPTIVTIDNILDISICINKPKNLSNISFILGYQPHESTKSDSNSYLFILFYKVKDINKTYTYFMNNVQQHVIVERSISLKELKCIKKVEVPAFPDHNFNEVFLPSKPTRFFFDLDYKYSDLSHQIPELVKKVEYATGIKNLEYGVTKNNVSGYYSRHVIFTNLVLPSIEHCKQLARLIKDNYIDQGPYSSSKPLRTLWSIKDGGKMKVLDYNVGSQSKDECYLIQPPLELSDVNYIKEYKQEYNDEEDESDNTLIKNLNIDDYLKEYSLKIKENNKKGFIMCIRTKQDAMCPNCERIHGKLETNYIFQRGKAVYLKCFRDGTRSIKLYKDVDYINTLIESSPPMEYKFNNMTKYTSPYALMPEVINGDMLYLVSPCKSGKTKCVHDYIENSLQDKSICFITSQRLLTTDLHSRFMDLGFQSYLDKPEYEKATRLLVSINSLHLVKLEYDIIIIDEIESVHYCFASYMMTLGNKQCNSRSINKFNLLINQADLILAMDAYPHKRTLSLFKRYNRNIHIHINEYKTHKDDEIKFVKDSNYMIYKMARCLMQGEKIVFASAWKDRQKKMIDKVLQLIDDQTMIYIQENNQGGPANWHDLKNIDQIESKIYNKDQDRKEMEDSISDIENEWMVDILAYTPCIMAGVSFEKKNFHRVFYYGTPSTGYINALQSLYRVRDVEKKKYYINVGPRYYSDKMNSKDSFEKYLNYNHIHEEFEVRVELADNLHNNIMISSNKYAEHSNYEYYNAMIQLFKYNECKLSMKRYDVEDDEDKKEIKNIISNLSAKELSYYIPYCDPKDSSRKEIPDVCFMRLTDKELEALENKVNKTIDEEHQMIINIYMNMFPMFNNEGSQLKDVREQYKEMRKSHALYCKYYRAHEKQQIYVTDDSYIWENKKLDLSKEISKLEPEERYRLKVASRLLRNLMPCDDELKKRLKGKVYPDEAEEIYTLLHDYNYTGFDLTKLKYGLVDACNKDTDMLFHTYLRSDKANELIREKVPIIKLSTKAIKNLVDNILLSSFGLVVNLHRGAKNKIVNISLTRRYTLF